MDRSVLQRVPRVGKDLLVVSEKREEKCKMKVLDFVQVDFKMLHSTICQVNFPPFTGLLRSCFFLVMIFYLYFFLKIFGK